MLHGDCFTCFQAGYMESVTGEGILKACGIRMADIEPGAISLKFYSFPSKIVFLRDR